MSFKKIILILLCCICLTPALLSWGFWGHKRANKVAVFTLHQGMIDLYKENIDWISAHAVDPDMRRYASKDEAPRHFIDLDRYGKDNMPKKWDDAVAKYSEDTLKAHGIVPWHIVRWMYRLTDAFKEKDKNRILRYSAELGHYIADAHVPLHTTKNYNGQLTAQIGIHGFWESRIPELMGEEYDYFVGKSFYIDDPLNYIWEVVYQSHSEVDSVLSIEKELSRSFPSDRMYAYEQRGTNTVRVYSEEYSRAYSDKLSGMVERKLRAAIISIGSVWYTCWVNAGQPPLNGLLEKPPKEEDAELDAKPVSTKQLGRPHEDEPAQ